MDFYTAIVSIVAIVVSAETFKSMWMKRGASALHEAERDAQEEKIKTLETEIARLKEENQNLVLSLEEQRILADEAVSTFGSRLRQIKNEPRHSQAPPVVETYEK